MFLSEQLEKKKLYNSLTYIFQRTSDNFNIVVVLQMDKSLSMVIVLYLTLPKMDEEPAYFCSLAIF